MSVVLHINGWPGCGKLTIGRIVAGRLGARLLDNHTLLNPASALFDRDDPLHGALRQEVRAIVLGYAARLAAGVGIVLTDALADDAQDTAQFAAYRTLAAARGARLVSVVLACEAGENVRRLTDGRRADQHKLMLPETLHRLRGAYRLLRPEGVEAIALDVTALDAETAAEAVLARLGTGN